MDEPWATLWKESVEWVPVLRVRVARKHGEPSERYGVIVDTGTPFCLFRADIGREIGLNIERGVKQEIGGVVSAMRGAAFFHKVNLYIEDNWLIEVNAGFVEDLGYPGFLGRRGFFDKFTVRFDHSSSPPSFDIDKIPSIH